MSTTLVVRSLLLLALSSSSSFAASSDGSTSGDAESGQPFARVSAATSAQPHPSVPAPSSDAAALSRDADKAPQVGSSDGGTQARAATSPRAADTFIDLPPVVVTLPFDDAPEAPSRRDGTATVTVIDVEEQRAWTRNAAELLAQSSGVFLSDLGGFGQAKSISIRGASSNGVLVLLDGLPLNGAGGVVDLSRVPAAIVSRFEVSRGAAGSRHGSGGLGGALHIATRPPSNLLRAQAELSYGSFETAQAALSATGPLFGGEALALIHGGRSAGTFRYLFTPTPEFPSTSEWRIRQNNSAAQGGGLLRFRRTLASGWKADGLLDFLVDERGRPGSAGHPMLDARETSSRLSGIARAEWEHDDRSLSLRVHARDGWLRRYGAKLDALSLSGRHRLLGSAVEGRALIGAHAFSAQLELGRESFLSNSEIDPVWLRASAMLVDDWLLLEDALTVSPSLRVERVGEHTMLSPKLGAAWLLPRGFGVRANVGQASRAPSFLELYVPDFGLGVNPALRPERALAADLSFQHETARTRVSAGGFASVYEDLILYEYFPPLPPRPQNFLAAHVYGGELEGALWPSGPVSLNAGYTLTFSENRRDDPRYYKKELPNRPRHAVTARGEAGPSWLRFRLELLAQSEQFVNRTASLRLPARAFLHAGVVSELVREPRLTASVEVRNLFDVQAQDFAGFPLPGRSFFFTLTASLEPSSANASVPPRSSPLETQNP